MGRIGWFTQDLRSMREHLRSLYEYKGLYPACTLLQYTKNYKRRYKDALNLSRKHKYNQFIQNSSSVSKACWDVINNHRKTKKQLKQPNVDVNKINLYLVNVASSLSGALPRSDMDYKDYLDPNKPYVPFSFRYITYNEVRLIIRRIKNKAALDAYDFNTKLMKMCRNVLIIPITNLINECLKLGVFPTVFKRAKVIPIYKKGNPNDLDNYRPISILPVLSKVFETVLKDQIVTHFENNTMFFENQFGFRSGISTSDAINYFIDYVVTGFEEGKYVSALFCDLSKAFDCVPFDALISKLKHYNFSRNSLQILDSYLTDRTQYVEVNNKKSKLESVSCGVPQGSVLGPVLFLIYVNDLERAVPGEGLVLFADDTTLLSRNKNLEDLQRNMKGAQSSADGWFKSNRLCLNINKTKNLVLSKRNIPSEIDSEPVKFLGVTIDGQLNWSYHIDELSSKIAKNIFVIRNLTKIIDFSVIMTAYHSLILSHITYAITCWGHSSHIQRIFKLQRKVLRIMLHCSYREDVKSKFIEHKILTVPCLYIYHTLVKAFKHRQMYKQNSDNHDHNTRGSGKIRVDFLRLEASRFGFNYFGPKFLNHLPVEYVNLTTNTFKRLMKQYLADCAFYSINEFLESRVILPNIPRL